MKIITKTENWRRTAKPVSTGGRTWRACCRKMKLGSLEAYWAGDSKEYLTLSYN